MKRILVVEDSPTIQYMIKVRLEGNGYEVVSVNSAEEGLDTLKEEEFDLIVSDIKMHGLNGLGFCKRVKEDKKTRNIPFLFLTVLYQKNDIEAGYAAGADGYLVKPYKGKNLLENVEKLLVK